LAPNPRYTLAVNIRKQDKFILDALILLSQIDRCDITTVARRALEYYVRDRQKSVGEDGERKMDEFMTGNSLHSRQDFFSTLLTPEILKGFSDTEIIAFAKTVRARHQELDGELRKRGYFLKW